MSPRLACATGQGGGGVGGSRADQQAVFIGLLLQAAAASA